MNDLRVDWTPNPHLWRKMKQAEKNFLRLFQRGGRGGRRHRLRNRLRVRYWALQFKHNLEKVFE